MSCPIIACDWCSGRSDDRPECPAHPTCRDVIRAWEQGREAFRREVANALADAIESARVHDTSGYFELSALRRKLEAGTFPKPPPSSGGEGGG